MLKRHSIISLSVAAVMAITAACPVYAARHTVSSGDTLGAIGTRYGVQWQEIAEKNNITDERKLMPGTVLHIGGLSEDGATYTMVYGDTLGAIGRELGIEWQTLAEANNISDPTRIQAGTVLTIPGAQTAVAVEEEVEQSVAEVQEEAPAPEEEVAEIEETSIEEPAQEATEGYTETALTIPNEDYLIPAVLTMPEGDGPFPGIVMLHGTGSDKDEAGGGYKLAAPEFAKEGIASIRIDFIGNGESQEDYINYSFTTAVSDASKAGEYIAGLEKVDADSIGVMGWSQGGTIALLSAGTSTMFKSVVTWAGAAGLSGIYSEEGYEMAKEQGYSILEFDWRENLNLGLKWYEDVIATDVLGVFSASNAPVLAINGLQDTSVAPENAEKIVATSTNPLSETYLIDNCDHTFNMFSGDFTAIQATIKATADFFNLTLAADAAEVNAVSAEFTEHVVSIANEGRQIPATVLVPAGEGPFPAVVMNHGHGGSREEGGGFQSLAEAMASAGILTIRMDFPGCGESAQPFTEFTLSNMISDSNASYQYMVANYNVDKENIGILGYSMGGRISLTIGAAGSPYKAMALLAPSADAGAEAAVNMFGGQENYDEYLAEAKSDQGYAQFVTVYGQEQQLSEKWFEDMNNSMPLENIDKFQGPILLMYGDKDDVVTAEINELVVAARPDAKKIVVPNADHGYGFYSDQPDVTAAVEGGMTAFFLENLQ